MSEEEIMRIAKDIGVGAVAGESPGERSGEVGCRIITASGT